MRAAPGRRCAGCRCGCRAAEQVCGSVARSLALGSGRQVERALLAAGGQQARAPQAAMRAARRCALTRICANIQHREIVMTDPEYMDRAEAAAGRHRSGCDRINDATDADIDNQRVGGMITIIFRNGSQSSSTCRSRCMKSGWRRVPAATTTGIDGRAWVDTKTGDEFFAQLSREATRAGRPAAAVRRPAAAGLVPEQVEDAVALFRRRRRADRRGRRSASAGGVGAGIDAQAGDAAARRVVVVVPLAADVAPRRRGAAAARPPARP